MGVYTLENCLAVSPEAEYTQMPRLRNSIPSLYLTDRSACAHQKKYARMILAITCNGPKLQIIYMPIKSRSKNIFWYVDVK